LGGGAVGQVRQCATDIQLPLAKCVYKSTLLLLLLFLSRFSFTFLEMEIQNPELNPGTNIIASHECQYQILINQLLDH
jgi:hypothetical protein